MIFDSEEEMQRYIDAKREIAEENEAYYMEQAAIGWAEDAAELWIPTNIPPVKDGEYLTVRAVANDKRVTVNTFKNGEWVFNGVWKVTAWLPMPDTE